MICLKKALNFNGHLTISKSTYTKLSVDVINPNVVRLEYAVRGPIVQRAQEIENSLKKGEKRNFDHIIRCNIGDCQAAGQKPISFIRNVLSVATNHDLFKSSIISEDAKLRANRFLDSCGGSIGVYSQSTGVQVVREDVARYIESRDGLPANPNDIFLSSGASEAVKLILQLLSTGLDGSKRAGVLVPIPQYPLYSATNAEYNAYQIGYYLDEANDWSLDVDQLESTLKEHAKQCEPRVLVVINPGNPTGQVLPASVIRRVLEFAHQHNLVVLADEVYQHNIYTPDRQFVSFKRVLHDMGGSVAKELQLASFMSCSKGYMGECGLRGGYCELTNFDPGVQAQLYKCLSARLCSSLLGQLALDVVVNPPQPGEPSYESYTKEKNDVLSALQQKATLITESLNALPGFRCNPITGAMYAFPQIKLPPKAVETAKAAGMKPDFMYCLKFLEETGVCIVPGSGFGQVPGTWHFRITILPPIDQMKVVMEKLEQFHTAFMNEYS
ncbi:Alanine aminotransferase [Fasciolopsis buskii]|uniref:alanine transaminase n=1 Tax=Fasciolopsis buskii TaxID=27845 RepID=A0A8E0RY91_9TREM|nr:Alanine aminotransferase [Fasciolopsis buski]